MLRIMLYALICVILAIIFALVTIGAVYLVGDILYYRAGRSLHERFFYRTLEFIRKNGRGLDKNSNAAALAKNLRKRLSWARGATMLAAALVAIFVLFALKAYVMSGNVILCVACIGMFVGMITSPIHFYEHTADLEKGVKCVVGRFKEVKQDGMVAVFVDCAEKPHEFCLDGHEKEAKKLVFGGVYLVADYVSGLKFERSDEDEAK